MSELPKVGTREYWDPYTYLPHMKVKHLDREVRPWVPWLHLRILCAAIVRAYAEKKNIMHLKARREGSTTTFVGVAYQHASTRPGTWAALLGYKKESALSMSDMAIRYWQHAPPAWKPARQKARKRELIFPGIDSKITAHSVKDDEPLRGEGVHFLLANEISSWEDSKSDDAWVAARNALSEEGGLLVADSTGIREGDPMHQLWLEGDEPGAAWVKCFIPWVLVDRYAVDPPPRWAPHPLVTEYRDTHEITEAQAYWMHTVGLGKCKYDLGRFLAEYPYTDVEPFLGTGDSIFDARELNRQLRAVDGGTGLLHDTADWQEFVAPKKGHTYVVAVDPAGSWAERDMYGVVVLDVTDCEQVAEGWAHMHAFTCAKKLIELSARFNNARIYVEANGIGEAVLSHLEAMGWPYVYYRRDRGSARPKPGWWSNMASKAAAIDLAQELIRDGSVLLHSARLIKQLLGMRGAWGARSRDDRGGHYDLAAAFCIACWAYRDSLGQIRRVAASLPSTEHAALTALVRIAKQGSAPMLVDLDGMSRDTPWGRHR